MAADADADTEDPLGLLGLLGLPRAVFLDSGELSGLRIAVSLVAASWISPDLLPLAVASPLLSVVVVVVVAVAVAVRGEVLSLLEIVSHVTLVGSAVDVPAAVILVVLLDVVAAAAAGGVTRGTGWG